MKLKKIEDQIKINYPKEQFTFSVSPEADKKNKR